MDDFYYNSPRKGVSAAALIFNSKNELLIVRPSYKDHWSIPGGISEKGETPWETCLREVNEETGLNIEEQKKPLCVSYSRFGGEREYIQFIFYGGILKDEELCNIKIDGEEILEHKFVGLDEISGFLSERTSKRVLEAARAGKENRLIYGEEV